MRKDIELQVEKVMASLAFLFMWILYILAVGHVFKAGFLLLHKTCWREWAANLTIAGALTGFALLLKGALGVLISNMQVRMNGVIKEIWEEIKKRQKEEEGD